MKKNWLIILVVAAVLGLSVMSSAECGDTGGDGKTGCKNCGSSPVYALGFCKTCYKGFHDFTYGDD